VKESTSLNGQIWLSLKRKQRCYLYLYTTLVKYNIKEDQSAKLKEKKHKDKEAKKKATLPVNEVLKIDTPKRQRSQRDTPNQRRRGNAGKGFPAKRGGSKQDINLLNEVNFPALSTKA
jgi:hypothetical protein